MTVTVLLALMASPLHAQTRPVSAAADLSIADFEADAAAPVKTRNATVERITNETGTPHGQAYLRMTPTTADAHAAYVRIALPANAGLHMSNYDRLTASVRAPQAPGVEMRWMAVDGSGRAIFQRRFTLLPGEKWVKLDEPLRTWRWDDRFVGDWDEVCELVLRIDSPASAVKRIDVDDIRLSGAVKDDDRAQWLMGVAFGKKGGKRFVLEQGMLVATNAMDAFEAADLHRLSQDMQNVRAFLRRVFGDAVRPTDHDGPVALLIFSDDAAQRDFLQRLAQQWRAEIAPPTAQGYTVQDIATSTYRKDLGTRRPVYLHESVHAIVARDLGLLTGNPSHTPLQEGLANYIQLCAFPQSLNRDDLVKNFAKPIDESGAGFFKPLGKLFSERVTGRQYAQLASFVAYMVAKDPDLMRDLARGLADGAQPAEVLARRGSDWPTIQKAWLAWGRERFRDSVNAQAAAGIFDVPVELRSSLSGAK